MADRRTITIDVDTGEWLNYPEGGLTGPQAAKIASAMMPGTTERLVHSWYKEWLAADSGKETKSERLERLLEVARDAITTLERVREEMRKLRETEEVET